MAGAPDHASPREPARGNVLGVGVDRLEHREAVETTLEAMRAGLPWRISLLAVHGVMGGALHPGRRRLLNRFELNLTCGQPVRWALNLLDSAGLRTRVYGPDLTLAVSEAAGKEGMPVYLYGSTDEVLDRLEAELGSRFPELTIAGRRASAFRPITRSEQEEIAAEIASSGAAICFVGLGCPRQENFIDAMAPLAGIPMAGVGGSFEFIAGTKPSAPVWMKQSGLEWVFRLGSEPARLWRRFLFLNPLFLILLAAQKVGVWRPSAAGKRGSGPGDQVVPG